MNITNRLISGIIVLLLFCCSSCNRKNDEVAVARVFDEYLYPSDLEGIVPKGTSAEDSIKIIQTYIDGWIRTSLLVHQAEKNLTEEQMGFADKLKTYENSLIIYTYESELIRQQLDTNVSLKEISEYYDAHPNDFVLKDNILRVNYVKLNKDSEHINTIKQMLRSESESEREKLAALCIQHASNFYLDDHSWLLFNDLLKEIPIQTYNQEQFLKYNRFIETSDSLYAYLMNIYDFKIKESLSPLSFERENIRNIIINKRKVSLINNMKKEVYQHALENSNFEIVE